MTKLWNSPLSRGANYYLRMKTVQNSRRQVYGTSSPQGYQPSSGYSIPSRPPLPKNHPVYQAWARGELNDH